MAQPNHDLALHTSSSGYSTKQPQQERQPIVRSRANITSACLACKRRKRKCLGGTPCPHCASLRIQCSYDERLDKRRKAFNDKAKAEIDFQRRLLDGLIKAIKSEHSSTVLDMVRADASLEELAAKLEQLDMLTASSPESSSYSPRKSREPEIHMVGQYSHIRRTSSSTTTSTSESDNPHGLSINQLLAPRISQQQQALNSSISIPSLSEVLLEAHKHGQHDREVNHTSPSAMSPIFPTLDQQQQLAGLPRHPPFSARIDVRPPGKGEPSLTSHPPQEYLSGSKHPHTLLSSSGVDPRLAISSALR